MAIATKTLLKVYVQQTIRKRDLEAQLKDCKAKLAEMDPKITEQFIKEGVKTLGIDGYTIYINRTLRAGPVDGNKVALFTALKALPDDWNFLVGDNVNTQQLAARIRECEMDEDEMPILPDSLKDVIHIYEQFKVGARKTN